MVGGFAESPYVYRQVKVDVEKQDIRVVKPAYALVKFLHSFEDVTNWCSGGPPSYEAQLPKVSKAMGGHLSNTADVEDTMGSAAIDRFRRISIAKMMHSSVTSPVSKRPVTRQTG